jgi:hypothetical protein
MTRRDPAVIALLLCLPMLFALAWHPLAWWTVPR